MHIGAAAEASGVSAKMIRYYEATGLLPKVARRGNLYRDYGDRDVHELRFIGRARALGFSVEEIGTLLSLWRDAGRPSRDVHRIAADHLLRLDSKIAELRTMADALRELVGACHGDDRPECPILDTLASARKAAGGNSVAHD